MPIPGGLCTSIFANDPLKQGQSTVFAPLQIDCWDATDPHILPKVYLTDEQPEDPSDSSTGHVYHTGAGSKHGGLSCSHGTFLHVAQHVAQCRQPCFHSLHITGPSQCPRVDKPHPASVAGTRPAVAWCSRKDVSQVVRNGSSVTNRHNRKFSQDTFDGDDVENRFLVVKLVHNPRTNRLQPNCNKIMYNEYNSHNEHNEHNSLNNCHNMYNPYNCHKMYN